MNLHLFNPEHDIALSYDLPYVCVPHAAQELRMNLGFLPALWAKGGDYVLVDDINYALKAIAPLKDYVADVLFVEKNNLHTLPIDGVSVWGWDKKVRTELCDAGISENLLPDDDQLHLIRDLSDRRHTSELLHKIRYGIEKETCGEAYLCKTSDRVEDLIKRFGKVIVKSPWSSSGRGVRYIVDFADDAKKSWINKIISHSGHIMVEPYYNKLIDFAVELVSDGKGKVTYKGLSVFHTVNAKYTGNVVASERSKRERLSRYLDMSILDNVVSRLETFLGWLIGEAYTGPLGVDMMIVTDEQENHFLLHPCVEINLRRTMGHVALALSQHRNEFACMMSIVHKVNYQLKVERIEGKFVDILCI